MCNNMRCCSASKLWTIKLCLTLHKPMDCNLQHSRLPCPSPSPRVFPSSCPLNQWRHPTISSSVTLFSFCLQSFLTSGSFPVSQLLWWPKYWSFSFSISTSNGYSQLISFKIVWLDFLASKGLSGLFSNTTVQKPHFFGIRPSLWSN